MPEWEPVRKSPKNNFQGKQPEQKKRETKEIFAFHLPFDFLSQTIQ